MPAHAADTHHGTSTGAGDPVLATEQAHLDHAR